MTDAQRREPFGAGQLFLCLALFFCHALFLRNHQVATKAVLDGLILCAKAVIPSLFPCLVLSSMLVEGNFEALVFAPLAKYLRLNPSAFCAVCLGLLCGAPVGARAIAQASEKGKLTKESAERLLCLVGTPSLPFLVGTVGGVFLGDLRFGWLLFLSTLPGLFLSALIFCGKRSENKSAEEVYAPAPRFSVLLGNGISSATKSVLLVSAYVVFFSALFSALRYCFSAVSLSPALSAFFYCLAELSGGLREAAALPTSIALPLCGFAVGFSGFAIFFQILSLTDRQGLLPKHYLPAKLLQGGLAALLFPLFCHFFGT